MSALGTKQTCQLDAPMSAIGGKADIKICRPEIIELIGGNALFVAVFRYISINKVLSLIKRPVLAGA
jgi:hypothetical protein